MMATNEDIAQIHDSNAAVSALEALERNSLELEEKVEGSRSNSTLEITPWEHDPFRPDISDDDEAALDEKWIRKATEEVQEKKEWRQRDIQALRELVQAERNLNCPLDDAFLLKFLRVQKFDYEGALKMIKRYFHMKHVYPQNFVKALPSLARQIYSHKQQTVLPHRDGQGRRVFLFRVGSWDPYSVSPSDIFAANYLLLETIAREPKSQIAGIVMVVDMSGFSFSQIMHVTSEHVKSVANIIQNTFPLRFREIHIINESYLFDMVFQLIKPFLSDRIKSRIVFHGDNLEKLHLTLDPSILPQEFGGTNGSLDNSELVDIMEKSEEFYKNLGQYGFTDDTASEASELESGKYPFQSYCISGPLPEDA